MSTWSERISQLEAAGWSLSRISGEVTLSTQALSDIRQERSKEPRGMAAVRLHALHARVCGPVPSKSKQKAA